MKKILRKSGITFLAFLFLFQTSGVTAVFAHHGVVPGGTSPSPPPNPGGLNPSGPAVHNASTNFHEVQKATDPVDIDRGEFFLTRQDFHLPGRSLSVDLTFTYRSKSVYNSVYGYGWDMTYNHRLRKVVGGNIVLLTGNNRKDEFAFSAGTYTPPPGVYATLIQNGDGTYTLTSRGGQKETFDPNGNLTRLEDKNGNAVTFNYDPAGLLPIQGKSDYFVNQTTGVIAREYRLTQIADTVGRVVTFAYNTDGRLESVTYSGKTTTYAYDPSGNGDLISVLTPPTAEFPSGLTTQYAYLNHNLTSATDPKGQTYLTNVYDSTKDQVTSQTYGSGTTTLTYDPSNPITTIVDRRGLQMVWTFNATGNPIKKEELTQGLRPADPPSYVTQWTYNSALEQTQVTLPRGNKIVYAYDDTNLNPLAKGNLLEIRKKPIPGSTDPDLVTTFTYEPNYQFVKTITDPRGNVTTYTYDYELGEPNKGNLRKITYPSVDGQTIETTFTYNAFGQVEMVTDPNGNVTKYEYDASTGYLTKITNGFGTVDASVTQMAYDAFGNVTSIRNPNSALTQFTYNALNQLTRVTSPTPFSFITNYFYDENGNLRQVDRETRLTSNPWITTTYTYTTLDQLQTITDELGNITRFTYDNNGNRTSIQDAALKTTTYNYDERDLLWKVTDANLGVTEYAYDPDGNLSEIKDAGTHPTRYTYDDFDRLKQTTYADSSLEAYTYDSASNLSQLQTPNSALIQYTYDQLNRLTLKTYPDTTTVDYIYDRGSRLSSIQNPASTIQYQYDPLNRVKRVDTTVDGYLSALTYQYDGVGNRTQMTYPSGTTLAYTYDTLNRLTQLQQNGSSLVSYTYDTLSRRTQKDLLQGNTKRTTYQYDSLSRLTNLINSRPATSGGGGCFLAGTPITMADGRQRPIEEVKVGDWVRAFDETTKTLQKDQVKETFIREADSYFIINNTLKVTGEHPFYAKSQRDEVLSDGERGREAESNQSRRMKGTWVKAKDLKVGDILKTVDGESPITSIERIDQPAQVFNFHVNPYETYFAGGILVHNKRFPVTEVGPLSAFIRDHLRIKEAEAKPATAPNLSSQFTYTYDNVGNRLTESVLQNAISRNMTHTYDNLYQLTGVTGSQTHSYQYDPLGNRQLADGTSYVPNNLNQYSSVGGTPYTYDLNGNLTGDGSKTYSYDVENRLTAVTAPGPNVTYTYDGFGRRIKKQVNATTTYYLHDGDQVIEERGSGNVLQATYTYGTGIDEVLTMSRASQTYYYFHDGLGSVTDLTKNTGELVESYQYDVYGQPTTSSTIGNPYLFTGREYDQESGLYYYRARFYHPGIGRFLQRDPVGYLPDINVYRYVSNNPVNFVDPRGLDKTGLFQGTFFADDPLMKLMAALYLSSNPDQLSFLQGLGDLRNLGFGSNVYFSPGGSWWRRTWELVKRGYVDVNFTGGNIAGVTGGLLISQSGIYPYLGGALTSPYGSVSITWSPSEVVPGWNVAVQGGVRGVTGQFGYSFGERGSRFWEVGLGWPGFSFTTFYVWDRERQLGEGGR